MATEASNKSSSVCLTNSDEIKKVFNKFDKNGDGKISTSELVHIMKSLGSETSEEEVKQMMKTIDTDSDGYISLEEFTGFCKSTSSNGGDENDVVAMKELKDAFDHYDLNKNGLISSSELHQILSKLGEKCTEDDCVKMIKSVDADGDGFVDFVEFQKMMSRSNGGGGEGEGAA
uniref:calcium-binding allergen Ole e 8-like n=1 Tax=Erigeron canadensis TaxID=72917 RepID=UPI001CB892EE|nr:calcium-binding allergen Ole e 8-like [Erigeron canadensis]